ncbi:MAG: dihydrodipicolinate synthase family protein [Betaproteobacteria bacterium]|nr:MAG: dihydrodipicolinate synthase family protein [Betaproteobacteria bacterium]
MPSPARPRGVIAATATPVDAAFRPDLPRLLRHCRALLDGGCDAINLLGTTGEATSFSLEQRLGVMRAIFDAGMPMHRFMVGTGLCSLDETATLTRAACEMRFAGALVLPPFFYPLVQADGLITYVDALIARVDRPSLAIYLYHIPQNTQVPWPVSVVAELRRRHPAALVGLKDSAGDLAYSREIVRAVPELDVFPGSEASLVQANADGFAGCISASVNLTAAPSQAGWSAQGTPDGAAAIAKAAAMRAALSRQPLIASVKAALAVRYDDAEWSRLCPPLQGLSEAQSQTLHDALAALT